jgi:6-phosphogluconolactonase
VAQSVIGEIRVVDDVPEAFAHLVAAELRSALSLRGSEDPPFRLGCSGGSSGTRSFERLAHEDELAWERLELYFADERCVEPDAPQSNQRALREALGERVDRLHGFYPMSCTDGPEAYEAILRRAGGLDLLQLGFGPDGHTASLFPDSAALEAPADQLVARNVDPSGRNPLDRLTLTYAGIATAALVVVVVTGAEKQPALAQVVAGGDLPAARVRAPRVIWLCDEDAAKGTIG